MSRKLLIPIVAVAALAVLGGGGASVYYFSGLRTAPPALALSSPTASASATGTPSSPSSAGTGTWTISAGSLAGYRVKDQSVGQSSVHEAVARTSDVTGQVSIAQSGTTYQLTSATVAVRLGSLASVDQVAGYNVTKRDRSVQGSLGVSSFPTAVFVAQPVTLPAGVETGQTVNVTVPGKLTIHGVARDVTANLQLRVSGTAVEIAGTIATNMTDFGISPPSIGFTNVQPAVTIEVSLSLTQGA